MKKKAGAWLIFFGLGIVGLVFGIGCFIIYISGLVLDLLAFIGLLSVGLGSLIWGRLKRTWATRNNTVAIQDLHRALRNPIRK